MRSMRQLVWFLVLIVLSVDAYSRYAKSLKVTKPNSDGVYAFDLIVEKRLTMTSQDTSPWRHGTPLGLLPGDDQLKDCFANYTLNIRSNPDDKKYLKDVMVLDGKHRRVLTINGKTPGEPIVVPYQSEVLLRVQNKALMDAISIHVHGIDKHVSSTASLPTIKAHIGIMDTSRQIVAMVWIRRGDEDDRSVPTDANGKREVPSREYFVMLQDWATEPGDEAFMKLKEKTMKWMYGFDNFEKCWQPTRTVDGGNVGGAVPISALLINDKGWHNRQDIMERPWDLPLERFRIKQEELVLFRITNGGIAQELMLHIEGHPDGDRCWRWQ
ncbi:hypothetical protein COOONC_05615 [Cooperia oncophora]